MAIFQVTFSYLEERECFEDVSETSVYRLQEKERQDEREEQIPQIHSHMPMGELPPRVFIMGPEAHSVTRLLTFTLSLTQSEHCMFRVLWQMQEVCMSIQIGELKAYLADMEN